MDDPYSRTTGAARYAPLHVVAGQLIGHLRATFDVEIVDDLQVAADLSMAPQQVIRAVRVSPQSSTAAPLTFVFTGLPGVMVHAGALHEAAFPVCGCDGCEEPVDYLATALERLVAAVTRGGFSERYPVGKERRYELALVDPDGAGHTSGAVEPPHADPDRLAAAALRLRHLRGGWAPWPGRDPAGLLG